MISKNQAENEMPDVAQAHSLIDWLGLCASHKALIANYDRLCGTNLSRKGTAIELKIDDSTGRFEDEAQKFFEWCVDMYQRIPAV